MELNVVQWIKQKKQIVPRWKSMWNRGSRGSTRGNPINCPKTGISWRSAVYL
jgi:hypothetical protein